VERAIWHQYIVVYDGDQAVNTFLATLQLFCRTENYFLCKGRDLATAANLYLHWFDVMFHRQGGPAMCFGAKLARYADDFVGLAKGMATEGEFLESKLEGWLKLVINRDQTRTVDLKAKGASLDFLGYTFRWDRKKYWGSQRQYQNVFASKKAQQRERQKLHKMTGAHGLQKSAPKLIAELNRHLRGWANYFAFGFPSQAFRAMDWYLLNR
jgi:RNA-directed DNA polymerase